MCCFFIHEHDALRSFQSLLAGVQSSPYKLYLLIDEYDNFANEIMMSRQDVVRKQNETLLYGEGALKTIFKMIKSATRGPGLESIFIIGQHSNISHGCPEENRSLPPCWMKAANSALPG